jgi:hypothetical protein
MRAYAMRAYARWLFGLAAAFNLLIGLALLFLRTLLSSLLHLGPIAGTNVVLANLTGMFVALFGFAYAMVALDPVEYRPFIPLGAIGKLLAVVCVFIPWFMGVIPGILPSLVVGDFVFAILFLVFMERTRGS